MSDVIKKIKDDNGIHEGSIVIAGQNKFGDYQYIVPTINKYAEPTVVEAKYTDRFDIKG